MLGAPTSSSAVAGRVPTRTSALPGSRPGDADRGGTARPSSPPRRTAAERMSEALILYTTDDGESQIQLRADRGTVWLSQRQMAELFAVSQDNIGLHLKNVYEDWELAREATVEESSVAQTGRSGRSAAAADPLRPQCYPRGRLSGALAARRPVSAVGFHRAQGVPAQGLCHGPAAALKCHVRRDGTPQVAVDYRLGPE